MTNEIVVSVPISDVSELHELLVSLGAPDQEVSDVRSLDGETVATVLLVVTLRVLPLLRDWLVARANSHKETSITTSGVTIKANSAADAERLLAAVKNVTSANDPD